MNSISCLAMNEPKRSKKYFRAPENKENVGNTKLNKKRFLADSRRERDFKN